MPVTRSYGDPLPTVAPPLRDLAILFPAVVCASSAPVLMAVIAAPALAIAFWRNALALPIAVPLALWHGRSELRALRLPVLCGVAFAATMLGLHFAAMAAALDRTSVASAATLVCSQSVWAAVFSRFLGERLGPVTWGGTGLALIGVVLVTGVDASIAHESVGGNLLAVLAGAAGGAYMVTGGVVRGRLGATTYTALCYAMAAAVLLVAMLATGVPVIGWSGTAWLQLVALTVLAQLLGHSLFSLVLRSVSPSLVSVCQLLTVPIAALAAVVLLDERPPAAILPALLLMVIGIAIVVLSHRSRRVPVPEEA